MDAQHHVINRVLMWRPPRPGPVPQCPTHSVTQCPTVSALQTAGVAWHTNCLCSRKSTRKQQEYTGKC